MCCAYSCCELKDALPRIDGNDRSCAADSEYLEHNQSHESASDNAYAVIELHARLSYTVHRTGDRFTECFPKWRLGIELVRMHFFGRQELGVAFPFRPDSNMISGTKRRHVLPYSLHNSRRLVAEEPGKLQSVDLPFPHIDLGSANPARNRPDQNFVISDIRNRTLLDDEFLWPIQDCRFH